ncbi:lysozyme [Undibacterium rugosum]|uniref:Lysozyme n=1 Tax=Undibacterium rugosum TaxID=2762291 RepID=A0A923I0P9_9BURK|nr:lysozyme [Undibacterium rugosum]MBC3935654.1 lysozyme [Undibacterium rugosum]MBR7778583.1 lysozyme [Undibacterium rugosum]
MALRNVNQVTLNLVQKYEGIPDGNSATPNIDPYLDPVGIWTIGWGHAITFQGRFLKGEADRAQVLALYPQGITMVQAQSLLQSDLMNAGRDVASVVSVALNDNQFGALTSFTFNLGIGNLKSSTLLKKLNQGDYQGAADEFGRWVMAGGKPFPGLVARRAAERTLFLTPC